MKIIGIDAHLLLRKETTGVPRYAWMLLQSMMKLPLGADERVVLYGHKPKPEELILADGWSWKTLGWWLPRGWTHGRLSLEMMFHSPDLLFVPGHEVPTFVRSSTRVVTTIHDVVFRHVPNAYDQSSRQRQELAVQHAIRKAKILTVPSNATRDDLINEYHVAADRIVVTPLAPTIPVINESADDLLRRAQIINGQYVLYIGRIEKKKNVEQLVRAFALLKRSLGSTHPLKLVLAGTDGFGADNVRRAIEEEKMTDDVRMVGYVSDRDASLLLQHALCFTFPSKGEGFGIPILEAMEHGTPVVASYISALAEVAGGAALLVSPNDIAALANAMKLLMTDQGLRSEYIAKGRARAAEFSWDRCAKSTFDALRAAL
jgi:glycosyltransferase involved in cell wall biosynthesis